MTNAAERDRAQHAVTTIAQRGTHRDRDLRSLLADYLRQD